jgi:hypothetical protein
VAVTRALGRKQGIAAGLPASAWAISASISSSSFARMPSGEIASFSSYPVDCEAERSVCAVVFQ